MKQEPIQIIHYGVKVWSNSTIADLRHEECLCYSCNKFTPQLPEDNCEIANELYELCKKHDLVTPVAMCPEFNNK